MKQGATISGLMHLAIVLLVLFSGFFSHRDDSQMIQVAEVSLISAEVFDAAASKAPSVPQVEPSLDSPAENANDAETPEAEVPPEVPPAEAAAEPDAADADPDLSGVQALAEPDPAATEAPVLPDQLAEAEAAPDGASLVEPEAIGEDAPTELVVPTELAAAELTATDAPRIDTESAPPSEAEVAPEVVPETTEVASAEPPPVVAEEPPAAPEEATVQAVPEPEQSTMAPKSASRPRGRPTDLNTAVETAPEAVQTPPQEAETPEPEAVAETESATEDAEAAEIAAALAAVASEPEAAAPSGPPMTAGEKDGLRLAVQKCWNVPAGLANAEDLVVTVGVELAQDGTLAGDPYQVEPQGELGPGFRQAFEAARRALIRCAPYDLPADKYEQWRNLEVVFNPKNMVVR